MFDVLLFITGAIVVFYYERLVNFLDTLWVMVSPWHNRDREALKKFDTDMRAIRIEGIARVARKETEGDQRDK